MGIMLRSICWASGLLVLACIANAEGAPPADAASQPASHLLPANTEVHLRLLTPVASNTHKHGDRFPLEVAEAVAIDGATVIPSGARAEGEVIHAAKGGFGGRAGELILASRFITLDDQSIKLRSFSAGSGENRVNLAMGLSFVVVGIFVTGKDISLPAGTDVFAKVAADTLLPAVAIKDKPSANSEPLPSEHPGSSSMPDPSSTVNQQPTSATDPPATEIKNDDPSQP